ncbi:MAG: hypothetical protein QF536_07885 [Arenicellales bacterium]|nr:hypothetical protein [Arenicellales bacterium]MDP6671354.1 hypothetical protein [Arenicellales bacterium]MDP6725096.1 hypothetical protein [Arenicellales bacterium]
MPQPQSTLFGMTNAGNTNNGVVGEGNLAPLQPLFVTGRRS